MVYFHLSLHPSHVAFSSQNSLQSEGFSDDAALDQAIKKLEADLKKTRKKAANDSDDVIVSTIFPISRSRPTLAAAGRALFPTRRYTR